MTTIPLEGGEYLPMNQDTKELGGSESKSFATYVVGMERFAESAENAEARAMCFWKSEDDYDRKSIVKDVVEAATIVLRFAINAMGEERLMYGSRVRPVTDKV